MYRFRMLRSRKLFVTFFMILVIGITIAIISTAGFLYYSYSENIKNEIGISRLGQIKQASTNIDLVFSEVSRTSGQFLYDEQISNTIMDMLSKKENYFINLDKLGQRIIMIRSWNKIIHSVYLYFENTGTEGSYVVSSMSGEIYTINGFYDTYWLKFYQDNPINSQILPTREFSRGDEYPEKDANVITHIRPVPINVNKGVVVINVDEKELTNMIMDSIVRDSEEFLAIDEDGLIIMSSDKSLLYTNINKHESIDAGFSNTEGFFTGIFDGEEMIIAYTTSDSYGWRYMSLTPTDALYGNMKHINGKIIIICVVFILTGVIISFFLSSSVYKPINVLLDNVRSLMSPRGGEYRDEVSFLNEIFGEVFGKNRHLEQTVESSLPALKEKFFRTILSSFAISDEEYEEKLKSLNIPIKTEFFQVVVFEVSGEDREKKVKSMQAESLINSYIKNLIQNEFLSGGFYVFILETTMNNIDVIINFDVVPNEGDSARIISVCETVVKKCRDYMNIRLYSAIGKQIKSKQQLPESLGSALDALKYKQLSGANGVMCYNEIEDSSSIDMSVLFEKEEELIRHFNACDDKSVKLAIRGIIDFLVTQKTEDRNIKIIVLRLLGSIGKSADKLAINYIDIMDNQKLFNEVDSLETLSEIEIYLYEKCRLLIERNREKMSGRNWQLVKKVKEYINDNITDDISLENVVSISGMSSSHFSRVFKEETGSTFVEYLNSVRIEKAKHLLESTEYKIKEISEMVGFRNQTYFITTFKNMTGMTPNNYKSIYLWKKSEH